MFRVKESEEVQGFSIAERIVQATLFFALLANFASTYAIHLQHRSLSALSKGPDAVPTNVLEGLQQDIQLQFTTSVVLSAILTCCAASMWWLRRRYLSNQRSLRQIKMLAHDILASMDRGVVTTNRQGLVTSINSTAIRLLEVDFECVGRPIASVSTPTIPLVDVYRDVVEGQMTVLDRDFTVDRSGRVFRLRIDGHVLKDAEERASGCVVHLRDVTERMLLEERMRRMERFLSLATLASGLHHEIKNPLTALSIHIQLLEEQLADRPSTNQLVDVLKTEVARLNGVLDSFRSFAHLQRLSFQTTDVFGVLEGAVRLMRPQAAQQRVQITLLYPEGELPRVPLDVEKFEQAVLNLVINALEAMPKGGTLTISAAVVDGEFRVSVKDSGPGIPPHVQRNLFLPYFSTKATGSGMGLALSEKVISQHGGRIDFRTGAEGTTFDVTVPLEQRNGAT